MRSLAICIAVLCEFSCSDEPADGTVIQAGTQLQGTQLQGTQLQGTQLQGMSMVGFQFTGATLDGAPLVNLRVDKGELVAEQNGVTVRGLGLRDAHLSAQTRNLNVNPPTSAVVEYKIDAVEQ